MQAGFADRRRSPRIKVFQRIRIRPADPRRAEMICTTSNQSETGLYFMTRTGNYLPGMGVFVTRGFSPEDPLRLEEEAVVVRVDSLGSGHLGVAVHKKGLVPKRVLFVCVGNACRSPMAEALARHLAPDAISASSAGLLPLGYISPPTYAVLREMGIAGLGLRSRPLREIDFAGVDLVINMAGQPLGSLVKASTPVERWEIEDPFGRDLAFYRETRQEIETRVRELAKRLRASVVKS